MGGHDDMCSMNMLFSWSYKNTCVVFKWWHIKTIPHLVISFAAISFLAYLYEYLKYYSFKSMNNQSSSSNNATTAGSLKLKKSIWYGIQVGFSFMLMLVFMTYNGLLMIAVVVGAMWGHYSWGAATEVAPRNSLACH